MKNNFNNFYDNFHKKTIFQKRVVNSKNFTYRDLLKVIIKLVKPNCKILDIGCGAGTIDFFLASKGNYVTGIDVSLTAIESCIKSSRLMGLENNLNFFQMCFPDQIPTNMFEIIIFSEVLEHINSEKKSLDAINKILQTKGIVIVSVPSLNAPLFKLGFLKKFDKEVGHLRRYSQKSITKLFNDNGFMVIEVLKTEGILRNSLFVFPCFNLFVKCLNKYNFLSDVVSFLDRSLIKIFGESNIILLARKI